MSLPVERARGAPRPSCATCPGLGRSEWCTLGPDGLAALDRVKVRQSHRAGETIFLQGSACAGLHCIEEGTVALRKTDRAGAVVIVRLVHPSETLGCRTLFGGGKYSAAAVALTTTRTCFIDRETVLDLVARNHALARRFLRRMAEDLQAADDEKLAAATRPVRARVARLLLGLSERYGVAQPDGGFALELPIARRDMAALLGIRAESIARALRGLEDDGVATFEGRAARFPDMGRLLAEAGDA